MKLSTPVMYAGNPVDTVDYIAALERVGLDTVWLAEVYTFDAPTLMGYVAAKTERVEIGSGILPIYSRTPALTAMTAAGLDSVSGGRAVLGLGASGPQVIEGWHGVPFDRPLGRTREIIEICRSVWRREVLEHDGIYTIPLPKDQGLGLGKPLKLINQPVRERIPIWLAALGEKNVELTAELAEGWLPFLVYPEKLAEVWGDALRVGRAKRAPELGELRIAGGGFLAVTEQFYEPARAAARGMAGLYIGGMGARGKNFYNTVLQRYGYPDVAQTIQNLYLDGHKEAAAAAVPDDLIANTNLIGPPDYVRERIEALREAGITHLHVVPIDSDPVKLMAQVKEWIV
ncbi:MAG TPA: LLM class F420-dependent oxidoreductase [Pseudonocardia sp.]|jgi:F420-dependent oxidoreductase-like protein